MADFTYLWQLKGMDSLEEKATERILLEPYNYLLQLPGKNFNLYFYQTAWYWKIQFGCDY